MDLVTVLVKYFEDGAERGLAVCSAYLPYDSGFPPRSMELEKQARYCESENLFLIVGCDSTAHHTAWGSTNCNGRGEALMEIVNSSSLETLNRVNVSTFCSGSRQEVTDIILGPYGLLEIINDWGGLFRARPVGSYSHSFHSTGLCAVALGQNLRGTNWGSFRRDLREKLEKGPEMNMEDDPGLGFAVHWIQQALISAYENNCPLKPVRRGGNLWGGHRSKSPSEEKSDGSLIGGAQITTRTVGNSIGRLNGDIGRR